MKILKNVLLLSIAAFLLVSCNKDDDDTPQEVQVTFSFKHYVGNEEVEYNNVKYTNAFGNLYSVATLKYFISDIRLTRMDGSEFFFDMEHYVDGLDNTTLNFTPDQKIQPGEYSSISFIFGLNEEKNVNGRFPNPPESNMEWPLALGTGYHYMKLEGKIDSSGTISNYQAHTGPTNGNQNFIEVTIPIFSINATGESAEFVIKMDINKWWENPNTFDLNEMTMVMGNQEVQQKLHDNGVDVFSLMNIN
jgi:hypothetical protein